nr:MAG TPA: hypothetical protein [Caudoviricetes sp.]
MPWIRVKSFVLAEVIFLCREKGTDLNCSQCLFSK